MTRRKKHILKFFEIAQMCQDGQTNISVATQNRRDAIIAARDEIKRLREIEKEHIALVLHRAMDKEEK